jgi:hypothetical protein
MAGGEYETTDENYFLLVEWWNGKTWSIQTSSFAFDAVSCVSASMCTAVGSLAAACWNGNKWSVQPMPIPPGTKGGALWSVSCTSAKACAAVGLYSTSEVGHKTVVERSNGKRWSIQKTPDLPGWDSELKSVSCSSARACTAVGTRYREDPTAEVSLPLVERWNGTRWSLQTAASPADLLGSSVLRGVSCTSASACIAVGYYQNKTLVERWNGKKWSVQSTPQAQGSLYSVTCSSTSACTAVGSYIEGALVERWNGKKWSVQTIAG